MANNENNSEQKSFTITAPVFRGSSGGGGGPSTKTYTATAEQASIGYTKPLAKNDKIKFTFFDENAGEHYLIINQIETNHVNLTIQSNPITLILGIGQSAKLNLTSPDYYNLYVKLNSISNNKADITIQTINEKIPKEEEAIPEDEEESYINGNAIDEHEDVNLMTFIWEAVAVIIIILIIIFIVKKKLMESNNEEKKDKKSVKKKRINFYLTHLT